MSPAFWTWIPCSDAERELMLLDPLIPWPNDQLGEDAAFPRVCHARLTRVLEHRGWTGARQLPEIRRIACSLAGSVEVSGSTEGASE